MLKQDVMNTEEAIGGDLEVRHYGIADGTFQLYEDDGKSFDYQRGLPCSHSFTNQRFTETISKDDADSMFGSVSLRRMTKV